MFNKIRIIDSVCIVICLIALFGALGALQPTLQQVDKIFAKWGRSDSPGMTVLVIKDGKIAYHKAYGMANLQAKKPINTHTVFDLASTSKQFTAFCIALLLEDQRLSLEDDISKFFPKLNNFSHEGIKIKHLVYHTSGLPDYLDFMEDDAGKTEYDEYTVEDVLNVLGKKKKKFTPGSKFDYCNTNYLLLGEVVHRVTGETLRQFAEASIFYPLGMKSTHYHDNNQEKVANLALGYTKGRVDISKLVLVGDGGSLHQCRRLVSVGPEFL